MVDGGDEETGPDIMAVGMLFEYCLFAKDASRGEYGCCAVHGLFRWSERIFVGDVRDIEVAGSDGFVYE